MCRLRVPCSAKPRAHFGHLKGFSPVWWRMCRTREPFSLKPLEQNWHTYGLTSPWVRWCTCKAFWEREENLLDWSEIPHAISSRIFFNELPWFCMPCCIWYSGKVCHLSVPSCVPVHGRWFCRACHTRRTCISSRWHGLPCVSSAGNQLETLYGTMYTWRAYNLHKEEGKHKNKTSFTTSGTYKARRSELRHQKTESSTLGMTL